MMTTHKYFPEHLPQIQNLVDLLKDLDPKSWCLAGGACRKYFENQYMDHDKNDLLGDTDFDVFVFNQETFNKIDQLLCKTYSTVHGFTSGLVKFKSKTHPIKKIDVIYNSKYRSASEVIEGFDLRCCQCYFQEGRFTSVKEFLDDIIGKKLVINTIHRPYNTINRLMRYSKKGYNLTEDAAAELFDHIRILGDEEFDYGYSISDPTQFSYENYDEGNAIEATVHDSVVINTATSTQPLTADAIQRYLESISVNTINNFSEFNPFFTGNNT